MNGALRVSFGRDQAITEDVLQLRIEIGTDLGRE